MAIEWSGFSPELLVRLDRSASQPLRAQLEASLREAIRGGLLRAGERLPSSRELARELSVSRGMVQECYGQLLAEGYLTSRTGSATRVAGISGQQAGDQPVASPVVGSPPAPSPGRHPPAAPLIADFQPGVPDLSSFPRTDWAWAVKQACIQAASADLGYGDPRGSPALREVLAGYLRRVRAAAASPERMIISTGFAQGINLVLHALARQSGVTRVAFEDPGYGCAQDDETVRAALAMGIDVTYVPVDEQGLVVSELAASGAQAVVVTPAHQSPTGVVLSPPRRHALTDWARRGWGYVIEDDYDSEFRYDKEPVGALQGLAPDQVFLLGTASKALAPAVRLGWVHAPTIRQPNRLIAAAATASAATVPSSRDPVISPAAELLAPAAAASIGITDSSRKKLVSEVNSARNVTASGTLRSRAGPAVSGGACVKVLIAPHGKTQQARW